MSPTTTSPAANVSPSGLGLDEWGPLYGEEEDLRRAIQISIADVDERHSDQEDDAYRNHSGFTISGPQFPDYVNSFADRNASKAGVHERRSDQEEDAYRNRSGLTISSPQFPNYTNSFAGRNEDRPDLRAGDHHEISLPPELRHLLASSNRSGAHV